MEAFESATMGDQYQESRTEKMDSVTWWSDASMDTDEPQKLSNRQRKMLKYQKWLESKEGRKKWERERIIHRLEAKRAAGEDCDNMRKRLKEVTMASSACKQRVAIDMSFDDLMPDKHLLQCVKEVRQCYSANRRVPDPMQLYVTNFEGICQGLMSRQDGYMNWDIYFHTESYTDLFPKDDLVYLTSESSNVIDTLDDSKVYVIGGLVDENIHKGLCYNLALEKGIKHGRLPIDEFIDTETNALSIEQVYRIILGVSQGKTWKESYLDSFPPKRGVMGKEECDENDDASEHKNYDSWRTQGVPTSKEDENGSASRYQHPKTHSEAGEPQTLSNRITNKERREREKLILRLEARRAAGEGCENMRKRLKEVTMASSDCKQQVVLDMSFDDYMIDKQLSQCVEQISRCYSANRRVTDPMQLYVTSFEGKCKNLMSRQDGYMNWDIYFHAENYTNLFPKDDLVYLTSESSNVIDALDESKVYVIGGLVDDNIHKGLSYNLAVEKGIKHGRLPIDEFIEETGKAINMDQVYKIILGVSQGRTWKESYLDAVPRKRGPIVKEEFQKNNDSREWKSDKGSDKGKSDSGWLQDLLVSKKIKDESGTMKDCKTEDTDSVTLQSDASLTSRQKKKLLKHEKWVERKKRGRENLKLRLEAKLAAGEACGNIRKLLKDITMAGSACKQRVVIDMSFDDLMNDRDLSHCVEQISRCYGANRRVTEPMQFYVTSLEGKCKEVIARQNGYMNWDIHFHAEKYTDLFCKDELVYLTRESNNILNTLDDSKVYVIGGLVNHTDDHKSHCYNLAVEKGINHGRLPIDEFIEMGTKRVSIEQIYRIILGVTQGRTWKESFFASIPQRHGSLLRKICDENDDSSKPKSEEGKSDACVPQDNESDNSREQKNDEGKSDTFILQDGESVDSSECKNNESESDKNYEGKSDACIPQDNDNDEGKSDKSYEVKSDTCIPQDDDNDEGKSDKCILQDDDNEGKSDESYEVKSDTCILQDDENDEGKSDSCIPQDVPISKEAKNGEIVEDELDYDEF